MGPAPAGLEAALATGLVRLGPEGPQPAAVPVEARFIVLAYGARWCAPCRAFTRRAGPLARAADEAALGYAYVFVSQDRDRREALAYAREEAMAWLIAPPDVVERRPALARLRPAAPPELVVIDRAAGAIACRAHQQGRYLGAWATLQAFRTGRGAR